MAALQEDQDRQVQELAALASQQYQNQIPKGYFSSSLKLKISTTMVSVADADDDQEDLQQQQPQLRTCSECGKQFSSGKALGGHKRACLQKKNQTNPRIVKNKKLAAAVQEAEDDGGGHQAEATDMDTVCRVCHQSFRSLKSLYGHMRKHPDRKWRGVQPPKHFLSSSNHNNASASPTPASSHHHDSGGYYNDDDSDCFVGPRLKVWSTKRKRGSRSMTSSSSSSKDNNNNNDGNQDDEDEAMKQAVNDLLLLAQLDVAHVSINNNAKKERLLGSGYGLLKVNDDKKRIEGDYGVGFDNSNSEDTWVCDDDGDGDETDMMMNQKRKRRLNELDDDVFKEEAATMATTRLPSSYACPICNKTFDKHQALGGHVASHNKNKITFVNKDSSSPDHDAKLSAYHHHQEEETVVIATATSEEGTGESSRVVLVLAAAAAAGSEHKCNQCNKIFATGQALGGHMRRHYVNGSADQAAAFSSTKSQVTNITNSAGEVTQAQAQPQATRPVHNFDLNDTPPEYYQFIGLEAASAPAAATAASPHA